MKTDANSFPSLSGQLIAAMPGFNDPNFSGTLSLVCEHDQNGAIAFVINQPTTITLTDVFEQLDIPFDSNIENERVLCGGPVSNERGFVLHRKDGQSWKSTLDISEEVAITASHDIIEALANKSAPSGAILILGYAGWGEGQLEQEIKENSWLNLPTSDQILFEAEYEDRLSMATTAAGIDFSRLSTSHGSA